MSVFVGELQARMGQLGKALSSFVVEHQTAPGLAGMAGASIDSISAVFVLGIESQTISLLAMQILVKIQVEPSDRIEDAKTKIQDKKRIPGSSWRTVRLFNPEGLDAPPGSAALKTLLYAISQFGTLCSTLLSKKPNAVQRIDPPDPSEVKPVSFACR
jgi:hypothetical protein